MSIVLALCSAVVFGIGDYAGGRATRHAPALAVTLVGQSTSLALVAIALPVLGDPFPPWSDMGWGAAGGLFGVVGIVCLYYGLAAGAMTVVAPITAVVSIGIPVAVGLAQGERPGVVALCGLAVAGVSLALISGALGTRHPHVTSRIIGAAVVAGAGFGMIFVLLDRTSDASGLWPLLAARSASVPFVVVVAILTSTTLRVAGPARPLSLAGGVLDMTANVCYLLAARRGLLTIVGVVTGMYPASTIVLATTLDGERMVRAQAYGLALAVVALAMITIGR